MSNRQTVVFAGHFSVGTVLSALERQTVAAAACREGDPAVLVNDMGVFRRAVLFGAYGPEALLREERRAPRCGSTTTCSAGGEADDEAIDWRAYESLKSRLAGCATAAAKHDVLRTLIRELVAERIAAQGADPKRVRVFFERQLRNAASARLRNRTAGGSATWQPALHAAGVLDDVLVRLSRIPTCGAILLALYERLTRDGYGRVVQFYDVADRPAIENGERLYRILAAAKGWPPLEIESTFFTAPVIAGAAANAAAETAVPVS